MEELMNKIEGTPSKSSKTKKKTPEKDTRQRESSVVSLKQTQCRICEVDAAVKENNVLECSVCFKRMHADCHKPPLKVTLIDTFDWECPECKMCRECKETTDEDKIIMCEMCDRAVHIHCLEPPLEKVPSKKWFCSDCINCEKCQKKVQPVKEKDEAIWNSKRQRICEACE